MAYIMRPLQDSYGCYRCPSVAPFVGQQSYPGLSGLHQRVRYVNGVSFGGVAGLRGTRVGALNGTCNGVPLTSSTTLRPTQRIRTRAVIFVPADRALTHFPDVPGMRFYNLISPPASMPGGATVDVNVEWVLTRSMTSRAAMTAFRSALQRVTGQRPGRSFVYVLCNGAWPQTYATGSTSSTTPRESYSGDEHDSNPTGPTVTPPRTPVASSSGGGSSTPAPTAQPGAPLPTEERFPLWGWIGIGFAVSAVIIGATAAVSYRRQHLSGLMGYR